MSSINRSISVIIPVYWGVDVETFRCSIGSLTAQTLQPDEVVIVIDGSIGEKLWFYICDELANDKLSFSVKLVCCLKNEGPGYARTLGGEIASSAWLAIHDADDIYVSNRLELQYRYLSDDIDVVGAYIEERHDYSSKEVKNVRTVPIQDSEIKSAMKYYSPVNNATAIIRRTTFLRVGGYPSIRFGEDYVLWQRFRQGAGKFINIPKVVVSINADRDFFKRRKGLGLLKKEIGYLNIMLKEKHISVFLYLFKLLRSVTLRFVPVFLLKRLYRYARR